MCHGKDTVIYFAREKEIESRKGERGGREERRGWHLVRRRTRFIT